MITLDSDVNIYIYNANIDMRKSINGLVFLVIDSMNLEPQSKSLFLFFNKTYDKVKGIFWHYDGFVLLYKRKEQGKFKFPKDISGSYYHIDNDLLQWLLKGFDFHLLQQHPELKISKYF
jgi:transposase